MIAINFLQNSILYQYKRIPQQGIMSSVSECGELYAYSKHPQNNLNSFDQLSPFCAIVEQNGH